MRKTHVLLFVVFLGLLSGAGWFTFDRTQGPQLPVEQSYEVSLSEPAPKEALSTAPLAPPPAPKVLAVDVNLAVPFISQAPHANWDEAHEEFCEEASLLMAASFVLGQSISGPDDAEQKLQAIRAFEEMRFGYYKDTTAEETAVILREYYKLSAVSVVYEPTIADIRAAVASGKSVIVPAAGRQLGNPYFKQPGPLYHMLVVKGYTKDGRFITNDPGTRRGANYLYDMNVLWNAIHDWNGGDVDNGRKVMIVVG